MLKPIGYNHKVLSTQSPQNMLNSGTHPPAATDVIRTFKLTRGTAAPKCSKTVFFAKFLCKSVSCPSDSRFLGENGHVGASLIDRSI